MEEKDTLQPEDMMNIILKIPKSTVHLAVIATLVDDDGGISQVNASFPLEAINKARKDFLENVEDGDEYDVCYVLTEKGREYLKQLEQEED